MDFVPLASSLFLLGLNDQSTDAYPLMRIYRMSERKEVYVGGPCENLATRFDAFGVPPPPELYGRACASSRVCGRDRRH